MKITTIRIIIQKQIWIIRVTLPFVQGIGVLTIKLEQLKIKVVFTYPNKLQTAVTSPIEQQFKSNIYQLTCQCGAIYNIETKVGIKKRLSQHKRLVKINDIKSNSEIV